VKVLVFFALKEEARFFRPPEGCTVRLTLMGQRPARTVAERALTAEQPRHVFTCGFAGGLNPNLNVGTLVFDTEDERIASVLTSLGAVRGTFHCLPRVATSRAEKSALRGLTGADVVEMESGIIRGLCRERGLSSTTLRVISDAADEDLPLDFNSLMTPEGTIPLGGLIKQVALHPGRWAGLWRLQRKTALAARVLGGALENLLGRLG
jgi:nucleoside phosphorylase